VPRQNAHKRLLLDKLAIEPCPNTPLAKHKPKQEFSCSDTTQPEQPAKEQPAARFDFLRNSYLYCGMMNFVCNSEHLQKRHERCAVFSRVAARMGQITKEDQEWKTRKIDW
jgi:hypothetical protein